MLDQQPSTIRKTNRPLVITLAVMIIIIIVLIVSMITINIKTALNPNLAEDCMQFKTSEFVECISDKVYSFFSQNDCDSALKVYDDINPDLIEAKTLSQVYSYAVGTSISCNNEPAAEKWTQKMTDIMYTVEGLYFYE